jgi:hypothetical protein
MGDITMGRVKALYMDFLESSDSDSDKFHLDFSGEESENSKYEESEDYSYGDQEELSF